MKKIFLMLLGIAATINAMAVDYTAKAKITVSSTTGFYCDLMLSESTEYGDLTGSPIYLSGYKVALYVINGSSLLQIARAASLNDVPLALKTDAGTDYTFTVSNVEGTNPLYLMDSETGVNYLLDGTSFTIENLPANSTIENRFTLGRPSAPAPAYVIMKGDFANPGGTWDYSTGNFTDNGATFTKELNLAADTWYHFQLEEGYSPALIAANGSAFDKDHKSYIVPATGWVEQLTLHTDAAGTYTFTWTYANDKLEITFPAAPAPTYETSVTTNANGLATFSYNADLQAVESDVKLYKGDLNGNELVLSGVNYVKANQGVIVYGAANTTYHFNVGTGTSDFTGNELLPASAWDYAAQDGYSIYVLSGNMLYLYKGDTMKPNKAFLKVQNPISGNAPARISMRFNGTQDVENAEAEDAKAVKFVENGQVFIRRGNEVYNLQGQIVK